MGSVKMSKYNQLEESVVSNFINRLRHPSSEYSVALLDLFCPGYEHVVSTYQGYFSNETKKMARKLDDLTVPFFKGAAYATPIYLGMYELPFSLKLIAGFTFGAANVLINKAAFRFGQNNYSDINFPEESKKAFMKCIKRDSKKLRVSKSSLESHL